MTAESPDYVDTKEVQHPILYSALAYGAGMALGFLLIFLLLISPILSWIVDLIDAQQPFIKILVGFLLFLGTVGLGGAVAGAWGGLALSRFSEAASERRFMWRGAFSFFIAHAVMVLPAIAVLAVVAFLNPNIDVSYSKLPLVMALLGLIYGVIAGTLFGLQTAGLRRTFWVLLVSAAGFALGGLFLGFIIRLAAAWESGLWRLLGVGGALFFFGACGGAALALAYDHFQEERRIFPDTRGGRTARAGVLIGLFILTFIVFSNLFTLLTVNIPDLDEQLALPTVSTHWLPQESAPETVSPAGTVNTVLCTDGRLVVSEGGGMVRKDDWAPCYADPLVAVAADGRPHAVWYSDEVLRTLDEYSSGHFLVESILTDQGWSIPAIVAETSGVVEPLLSSDAGQTLYLSWNDGGEQQTLSMTPYSCDGPPSGDISQIVYEAVRQEQFRPADDPVPYCGNRFDRLHFTPNPTAPEQEFEDTPLGAFDTVADVARNAQYEVLFVTMQWDEPSDVESPGDTLTLAIADLYEKVLANPEQYPRGMTVRILLGNLPEPAVLSFANQLHHVITDLREAGVEVGEDPDSGWKMELANYTGSLPHAHSKFLVVDGKTAVAAGFNYSYLHLDEDYPHDLAMGMTDMGLQMTGPVAQMVLAAYDDLWRNSELVRCPVNPPSMELLFTLICTMTETDDIHPPEVLRFYPAAENDNSAFALHHTLAHLESDEALLAAIGAAQESIDLFEVNFSMNTPCLVLALVSDICQSDDFAPVYMLALRDAIVENDTTVRVMMEESAMNGIENRAGIRWLQSELEAAGKAQNLDLRFSAHKMHNKGMLVDKEFLSVGSQNFHYSAWGAPSLTEYNLATDDPQAVEEFLTEYEYWWNMAIPVGDIMDQDDVLAGV
jgi:phosphatidylserine/phosphatidylglycerophosphate/cardiolipin synthase-like enzyme/MFS family permease